MRYYKFLVLIMLLPVFSVQTPAVATNRTIRTHSIKIDSASALPLVSQVDEAAQEADDEIQVSRDFSKIAEKLEANPAIINSLIKKGLKINGKDKYGSMLLMNAAQMGYSRAVEALLMAGANANYSSPSGLTPLIITLEYRQVYGGPDANRVKILKDLLAAGANVNAISYFHSEDDYEQILGVTALTYAVYLGNAEFVDTLINAGANVNLTIEDAGIGITLKASELRGINDHLPSTSLMLAIAAINEDQTDRSIRLKVIKSLISAGADINARDYTTGKSALIFAVSGNHTDVVAELMNHKPNFSIKDREGHTAFDYAAENDNQEILKLLQTAAK